MKAGRFAYDAPEQEHPNVPGTCFKSSISRSTHDLLHVVCCFMLFYVVVVVVVVVVVLTLCSSLVMMFLYLEYLGSDAR